MNARVVKKPEEYVYSSYRTYVSTEGESIAARDLIFMKIPPYRTYAIYLPRNYTPVSNTQTGKYFGNISRSAVTKIGSRIKTRMAEDTKIREEIARLENELSCVEG